MSRLLAIDYGKRRVGFALSDPTRTVASGLPTYERRGGENLIDAVERLVRENDVTAIVLGLPLNMDGTRGPRAEEVERFADGLRARLQPPVALWDERLTTVRAQRILREGGVRAREGKQHQDRLSAVLILQSYLAAGAPGAKPSSTSAEPER